MRVCAARAHARACVRVRERGHLRAFARACTDKRSTGNNLRTSSGMLSARRACFPSPPWPRPPSAPSKQSIVAPRLTRARIPHMVRLFCPPRAPPRASAAVRVSLLSDRKFAPNSSATTRRNWNPQSVKSKAKFAARWRIYSHNGGHTYLARVSHRSTSVAPGGERAIALRCCEPP